MISRAIRVLVVDGASPDANVLELLASEPLAGTSVTVVDGVPAACRSLAEGKTDLVLLDLGPGERRGLAELEAIRDVAPWVPVLVLAEGEDPELAVDTARAGAQDYLVKGELSAQDLQRAMRGAFERVFAETPLAESQRAMSTLLRNLPGMAYRCRNCPEWTMAFVSDGCRELTGYERHELVGDANVSYAELIHPDDRAQVWETVQAALEGDGRFEIHYRIRTADGEQKWVWEQGSGVWAPDGELVALEGLILDITQRVRAERSSTLLATAVEQGADSLMITDLDGTIQYVNPAFERATGYRRDEVVGRKPRILKSGEHDQAFYRDLWETLIGGRVWTGTFINRRKDGSLYREEASIAPVRDAAGSNMGYVRSGRDVTREHELEEQLRQSQKMEAIGQLAGGVAHDFNNLLTAILGNCEMLLSSMHAEDDRRVDVEEIRRAGQRAASLTRQLLAFSRRQVMEPVTLSLNEVVEGMSKMVQRLIGEQVELELKLDPDLGDVNADPGQVEQIMLNLAVNARDAMPEGGQLIVETANVDLDADYVRGHVPVAPGPYVMLAVTDTGLGMDRATQERIFEPFYTTKGSGEGTGLGLSTVYGIVKQSRGYVWVYSEPGEGTSFKIYLPRVQDGEEAGWQLASDDGGAQDVILSRPAGGATALVVEDDDAVRSVVRRALTGKGYTVLEAESAEAALEIADSYADRIDLLISDLVMPRMSGPRLAERVAQRRSDVKVLFMSGYSDNAVLARGMLEPHMEFLAKPFTQEKLLDQVRRVLEAP